MKKGEALSKIQAQAKEIVQSHGVDFRTAMKAVSLSRKRSCLVDGSILKEANELVQKKREDKKTKKEFEVNFGKRQRIYTEHLLEQLLTEIKSLNAQLSKEQKQ